MKKLLALMTLLVALYLILWPVPVSPVYWQAPAHPGYIGDFSKNQKLTSLEEFAINNDSGPEDIAMDSQGNIVTALHSGAIVKLDKQSKTLVPWINTLGRPLGIEFDDNDNLIVADAYKGLLSISPKGQIKVLSDESDGTKIRYADDLDIAEDGKVYFSDASTKFGAQEYGGTYPASLLDILEHGGHGRLLMYDPETKQTQTLLTGINFANGVAVSHDQQSILINETGTYRVLRYWLGGDKKGEMDVVVDNLPGFPDNLAKSPTGGYWLGLTSPRSAALDSLSDWPYLRKVVQRLPAQIRPKAQRYGHVIKFSEEGEILLDLQDPSGTYPLTTGALETKEYLYISSLTAKTIARKLISEIK